MTTAALTSKSAKTADATPVVFPLALADLFGDGSKFATVHALANTSGALVNPATAEGVAAVVSALGVAATEGTLASAVTALNAIKAALLAQVDFSTLFVTDGAGNYYVRRESVNEGTGVVTTTFETMAGAAASPVVANLTPVLGGAGGTTKAIEATYFDATANGTGITAGDVLARVLILDLSNNTIATSYWHNMMTGAAVTPAAGSYVEQAKALPGNAATASAQASILTALGLLATAAQLPTSLGPKAKAAALAVTTATDDPALTAIAATGPGSDGFAVTPSDSVNFTSNARSLYVGVTGDVTVVTPAGTVLLHKNVPAGAVLPISAKRVNATGTTAANLLGYV